MEKKTKTKTKTDLELVLQFLEEANKAQIFPTRKELHLRMEKAGQKKEQSNITGRVSDLLDIGLVVEIGKRKCEVTGHTADTLAFVGNNLEYKLKAKDTVAERKLDKSIGFEIKSFLEDTSVSKQKRLEAWDGFRFFINEGIRDGVFDWQVIRHLIKQARGE